VGGGVIGFILAVIVAVVLVAIWSRTLGTRRNAAVDRL
jgi:predicted PurR-regulated permease PerM